MSNKIKIDSVTGGKDKDQLKGCYFLPSSTISGAYDFYDTNNNVLASGISGSSFSFSLGSYNWQFQSLVISTSNASGNWSNDDPTITADESGTFQAQAGGGLDEEEALPTKVASSEDERIKITKVTGGKRKDSLKDCYFLPSSTVGAYDFYNTHNQVLASSIQGSAFKFDLNGYEWQITKLSITPWKANGDWKIPTDPAEDDSGTFQAQAGGGGDPEERAAKAAGDA